ncbi:MAG TPA: hypothetical protein VH022_14415 [Candidatus Acidoferrum sp.]|jgi:hypothetical protein|nr:hypothetical protein [Candidatus Acidoferrum sp.]
MADRQIEADLRRQRDAGTVAAAVFNANPFRGDGPALTSIDFVPEYQKRVAANRGEQTIDEQIAFFSAAFGCGPTN